MRVPAWSGKGPSQGCGHLVVSSHGRRGEGVLSRLLVKNTNPAHEGSWPKHCQRSHLLTDPHQALRFQYMNLGEKQTFRP